MNPYRPLQVYIAYLSTVKKFKYHTIKQYLNIIVHMHRMAGFKDPLKDDYLLRQELLGVKRVSGVGQKLVDVITPQLLMAIHSVLGWRDILEYSFWAACLVAFFGLLRPGNVTSQGYFHPSRDIRRVDVPACEWGFMITLRYTKTMQFREKVVDVPLPCLHSDSALCPSHALQRLLECTPSEDPLGPLFIKTPGKAMTYKDFCAKLSASLDSLGIEHSNIKGHSFRRGGATWLAKLGVSIDTIKKNGFWARDAVYRYVDSNFDDRLQTMQHFGASIANLT